MLARSARRIRPRPTVDRDAVAASRSTCARKSGSRLAVGHQDDAAPVLSPTSRSATATSAACTSVPPPAQPRHPVRQTSPRRSRSRHPPSAPLRRTPALPPGRLPERPRARERRFLRLKHLLAQHAPERSIARTSRMRVRRRRVRTSPRIGDGGLGPGSPAESHPAGPVPRRPPLPHPRSPGASPRSTCLQFRGARPAPRGRRARARRPRSRPSPVPTTPWRGRTPPPEPRALGDFRRPRDAFPPPDPRRPATSAPPRAVVARIAVDFGFEPEGEAVEAGGEGDGKTEAGTRGRSRGAAGGDVVDEEQGPSVPRVRL